MEREKAKAEEYEDSLAEEEKVLEKIRDSLKGQHTRIEGCFSLTRTYDRQDTSFP
jgi:hypothetical protein